MRPAPSNRLAEGPLGGCWGPPYNNWKSLHGASVCTLLWYISVVCFVVVFAAFIIDSKNLGLCLGLCLCRRLCLRLERHHLELELEHNLELDRHHPLVLVLANAALLSGVETLFVYFGQGRLRNRSVLR